MNKSHPVKKMSGLWEVVNKRFVPPSLQHWNFPFGYVIKKKKIACAQLHMCKFVCFPTSSLGGIAE